MTIAATMIMFDHMLYPKTYATVVEVEWGGRPHSYPIAIFITTNSAPQRRVRLPLCWRNGKGHTSGEHFAFTKGTVVKVYQRPHVNHVEFRRIGA